MTGFTDNLYLGAAPAGLSDPDGGSPLGGQGVGPLGRTYIWDTVPVALNTAALAALQTPAGAGNLVLQSGVGGVTRIVNNRGETVSVLDVPRAVSITAAGGATTRSYTVTGYDQYGQRMSELIPNVAAASTVAGNKAFKQVLSVAVDGGTVTNVSAGTTDKLGIPFRVTDRGYVRPAWNNALAQDAGTLVVADGAVATVSTGDVRGTYVPSNATDGAKRLIAAIALTALAAGPNATRLGALGVNQNLAGT